MSEQEATASSAIEQTHAVVNKYDRPLATLDHNPLIAYFNGEDGKPQSPKDKATRRAEFISAVRANRVLAVTLSAQGLNEHADRFAYRAQLLQRQGLRRQRKYAAAFGSWLLDVVSGYGYKPMRSLIAYIAIICAFAGAYLVDVPFAAP